MSQNENPTGAPPQLRQGMRTDRLLTVVGVVVIVVGLAGHTLGRGSWPGWGWVAALGALGLVALQVVPMLRSRDIALVGLEAPPAKRGTPPPADVEAGYIATAEPAGRSR